MDVQQILAQKNQRKLSMLTCYDYVTAQALNALGLDMVLVGDSLAMVMLGEKDTHSISIDTMLPMAKAVKKGIKDALVIFDMPISSYDTPEIAYENVQKMKDFTEITAVKIEGRPDIVEFLAGKGVAVMGHTGLKPQSVDKYKVMGKDEASYKEVLDEAKAISEAGAFSLVLECVTPDLAKEITENIGIPTIGIGAGSHCDGQVLVLHDVLGLYDDIRPKFVRRYANMKLELQKAVQNYINDVQDGEFPSSNESY